MESLPAPDGRYYTVYLVTIVKKQKAIFQGHVLLNRQEDESTIISRFEAFKKSFGGLYDATVHVSTQPLGEVIRAQRFYGFNVVLHKCPTPGHEKEKGAFCRFCGKRLFRIVIVYDPNRLSLPSQGSS